MKINELHNLCNVESTSILHDEANLNKEGFALAERSSVLWDGMEPALTASYPPQQLSTTWATQYARQLIPSASSCDFIPNYISFR